MFSGPRADAWIGTPNLFPIYNEWGRYCWIPWDNPPSCQDTIHNPMNRLVQKNQG